MSQDSLILRQEIVGSRRFSNYFWATAISIGGVGFLLAGLSSYFQTNLLLVSDTSQLQFFPQGIALSLYGVVGTLLALYLWFTIFLNVGGGYNQFDRQQENFTIFRWGFPGKNRRIELTYKLDEIQSVRAEIKEGLNPKRTLYLCIKQRADIPLTRVGEPISLSELENKGAELARFLTVPLEGL
jgi:hypothetical protein